MADITMTKEELEAFRLSQMLAGVSIDDSLAEDDEDDDFEIEIIDEEKPKKKGRAKVVKKEEEKKDPIVPILPEFENLKDKMPIYVVFNGHDIPYKNQLWHVPTREVEYIFDLVKVPKQAMNIAEKFKRTSESDIAEAREGIVRYYRIVTYDTVLHKLAEIGYVRITNDNNKIKAQTLVLEALLKENNANPEKVKKNIKRVVKDICA